jgi:hypothetical protein
VRTFLCKRDGTPIRIPPLLDRDAVLVRGCGRRFLRYAEPTGTQPGGNRSENRVLRPPTTHPKLSDATMPPHKCVG